MLLLLAKKMDNGNVQRGNGEWHYPPHDGQTETDGGAEFLVSVFIFHRISDIFRIGIRYRMFVASSDLAVINYKTNYNLLQPHHANADKGGGGHKCQ